MLEELKTIYRVQFPVMRQYEADTWYDQNGRIVFTNSKGLSGVGFSRPEWNELTEETRDDNGRIIRVPKERAQEGGHKVRPYGGYDQCGTYEHIDPESGKSNVGAKLVFAHYPPLYRTVTDDTLPDGPYEKTIEYVPPFDKCDREEDYEIVWAEFERRFQEQASTQQPGQKRMSESSGFP